MRQIENNNLYTLYELAKKLDVNYMTVWNWKKKNLYPTVNVAGKVYVREEVYNNIGNYIIK